MIVLLGKSGYIAKAFQSELRERGWPFHAVSRHEVDYTRYKDLKGWLSSSRKTDLIINCAAFITKPSVDECDQHKESCLSANTVFPAILSQFCADEEIPLIHVSTGCLYNGNNNGNGWTETDRPHISFDTSCGWYVGCKEMAERIVVKNPNAWVCRIRLPFDQFYNPRNLLSKLQRFAYVCDEEQSITHLGDFAKACLDLWGNRAPYGLYNCTSPGAVTYRWLCDRINHVLYKGTREFDFLSPNQFDKMLGKINKSRCVLSVAKLLSTGISMRPVGDAVEQSLQNWVPENV